MRVRLRPPASAPPTPPSAAGGRVATTRAPRATEPPAGATARRPERMTVARRRVHPIEAESYRILAERVDLSALAPARPGRGGPGDPRRRRHRLRRHPGGRRGGLRRRGRGAAAGAPVVADVEMVAVATRRAGTRSAARRGPGAGRGATGPPSPTSPSAPRPCGWRPGAGPPARCRRRQRPDRAARRWCPGGGRPLRRRRWSSACPSGSSGRPRPRRSCGPAACPSISNVGERGGSAVAAAALNALWRMQDREGTP